MANLTKTTAIQLPGFGNGPRSIQSLHGELQGSYQNNVCNAEQYHGVQMAADVAGMLFDRWTWFDAIAEAARYNSEIANGSASSALAAYNQFKDAFQI